MRTLIVYAGKYGSTKKAAQMLKNELPGEVTLVNLAEEKPPGLEDFDAVVIGSSIYAGFIRPAVRKFCRVNSNTLSGKKVGLFICGGLEQKAEEQIKSTFPPELLSRAAATGYFGFEIHYDKMGFFDRVVIRLVSGTKQNWSCLRGESIKKFASGFSSAPETFR